jgi:HEPN domain-containing protein
MVDPEIVREWLSKADEDYDFAKVNLKERDSFFAKICFHFQQAAEKYLKAYIITRELEFKRTHDLIELLNICKSSKLSFETLREECEFLNGFYIETRYPVHWPTDYT